MERKFTDQEEIRRKKLADLKSAGDDIFSKTKFEVNTNSATFIKKYKKFSKEELHDNKDPIMLYGRIMAIRQTFGVIKDFYGKVQFYIDKKNINQKYWDLFSKYIDIGDIVGVCGTPMKTNTGETTVRVSKIELLSKALKPFPEKYHGLSDSEERGRKRYLDLIMNEESFKTFLMRSKIVRSLREFMDKDHFVEVETPVMQLTHGGAAAKPFITKFNALNQNFYLRVAPELHLKRLIVGGFEKVYEIGRLFRNEGMDSTHNPEFTTMEAYWQNATMEDWMDKTQQIFQYIGKKLKLKKLVYKDVEIDLTKPFKKISMVEYVKKESGVDFDKDIKTDGQAIDIAKKHNIDVENFQKTRGHILNLFFEHYCEKKCLQPTFVYGTPIELSPLAKKNPKDPRYTLRFELFICGKEYANCFTELNDPDDQLERFENQLKERETGNSEANEVDMDFVEALEYAMPPTAGIGIGIDRLVMLFTNNESIHNVLLFPHMKKAQDK